MATSPPGGVPSSSSSSSSSADIMSEKELREEEVYQVAVYTLLLGCEAAQQQHELSAAYFGRRNFWHNFLPMQLVVGASAILSFVASFSPPATARTLSLVVGCFASVGAFLAAMERLLGFSTRAEMHRSAERTLEKMVRSLEFKCLENKLGNTTDLDLAPFRKMTAQIDESCTSSFPAPIRRAFALLHQEVQEDLRPVTLLTHVERTEIQRLANMQLAVAIAECWNGLPRSWKVVQVAKKKLTNVVASSQPTLTDAARWRLSVVEADRAKAASRRSVTDGKPVVPASDIESVKLEKNKTPATALRDNK